MSRWLAPLFLVFILAGATGCVAPQVVEPPQITLQNVRFLNAQGLTQRLEVELMVANPNKFSIPLTGLKFDMQMNGLDFAQGLSNAKVDIPGLGRAVVPVEVTIPILALMQQIQVAQRRKGVDYRVMGTAFLDHALLSSIDFDRQGSIRLEVNGKQKGFKVM